MIRHFLFVWIAYWIAVLIVPVSSAYSAIISAFLLQFLFVFLVLMGYSWFWMALNGSRPPLWAQYGVNNFNRMISISLGLSIVGTLCLLYDKIAVQGIDYTQGIAVAREAWRKEGVAREGGVSSIFSVIGYLLSSGYFVSATLLILGGKSLSPGKRYMTVLMIFVLLMLNSVLAGGRSNVLLLAVFIIGTMTSVTGWSYKELFASKLLRILVVSFVLISLFYLLYVFSERAEATGITPVAYVQHFLPYLGLELDAWFIDWVGVGFLSDFVSLIVLAASYISHSFATTAAIVDHGQGDKVIVLVHPMNLLYKLHMVPRPDSSWFLAGRFPSLPGALLYQFGFFGFFVISMLLGFISGIAKCLYLSRPSSIILLCIYLMMYAVLVISPILLAVDFMSFPFVFVSFFLIFMFSCAADFLRAAVKR